MENTNEYCEDSGTGEDEYVNGLMDAIGWLSSFAVGTPEAYACIGYLEDYLNEYLNGQWWEHKDAAKLTPGKYVGITNKEKACILIVAENGIWIYDVVSKLPIKEDDVTKIMKIL